VENFSATLAMRVQIPEQEDAFPCMSINNKLLGSWFRISESVKDLTATGFYRQLEMRFAWAQREVRWGIFFKKPLFTVFSKPMHCFEVNIS
jgi:hypothetical protein